MKKIMVPAIVAGVVLAVVTIVAWGGNSTPRDPMTGQSEFDIPVQDPVLVAEGDVLYLSLIHI